MKKIICGIENVDSFRGELKAAAPEFYDLAKKLYAAGMITGLRGATLEYGPFADLPAPIALEIEKNGATCEKCGQWRRDTVGDGTGIGQCLQNEMPTIVKWPGTQYCNKFEG